jgi:uncharacterized membrane-anchored protein
MRPVKDEQMKNEQPKRELNKKQKEKLASLSITLLDIGFHGEELKAIMDSAVEKIVAQKNND